jgi:type IV pilus assembly protein PilA
VTLSDKSSMTYVLATGGLSYVVCAKNEGGSDKVYVYNSAVGGSVKAVDGGDITDCVK